MKHASWVCLALVLSCATTSENDSRAEAESAPKSERERGVSYRDPEHGRPVVVVDESDPSGSWMRVAAEQGRIKIQEFFGRDFPRPFELRVMPDRAALTAHWRKAWEMPEFEPACWMVASGSANDLVVLSPSAWKSEACEHDPDDDVRSRHLIVHEMVHVFHAQIGPESNFEGMDDIGWLVEGLATYASGQLEVGHLKTAAEAIAEGAQPKELEKAWSGPYRYGVSGSLVGFVDAKLGREAFLQLLETATDEQHVLDVLGMTEPELLKAWEASVVSAATADSR